MQINDIYKVFDCAEFHIVVDSKEIYKKLCENIPNVVLWDYSKTSLPENSLIVCTNNEFFLTQRELRKASSFSRGIVLPQVAFDNSFDVVVYSVDLLLASDFEYAFYKHQEWYELFSIRQSPFFFCNKNYELFCHLSSSIKLSTINDIILKPGEFRSVAGSFEINLENSRFDVNSFVLEGTLIVDGILFARGIDFNLLECDSEFAGTLPKLVSESKTEVIIKKNKIVSILIGEKEYMPLISFLAGYNMKPPNITEFAVGFNKNIRSIIKWEYNSQVNEGIEGIHIGIGDGKTGFHIDFIVSNDCCQILG